ncbi:uncharacterized protein LOC131597286 [Vicia villosa]|uniref:uncharacterized protein LOC131597286 n=1 Tax=Vicia villosa TaxID=3911 RepID=UPI00273AFA88|nr:uncharacterized protein LOC131597286 [Vicia villosa]
MVSFPIRGSPEKMSKSGAGGELQRAQWPECRRGRFAAFPFPIRGSPEKMSKSGAGGELQRAQWPECRRGRFAAFPFPIRGSPEKMSKSGAGGELLRAQWPECRRGRFAAFPLYCSHYNTEEAMTSKCLNFENGWRPEIKQGIACQKIRNYPELVSRSRIYDNVNRARIAHYKVANESKGKQRFGGTPYSAPTDRGEQKVIVSKKPSGGGAILNPTKCFRCGGTGHRANDCTVEANKCFKCERPRHVIADCRCIMPTCYSCGEKGHISTHCERPKKSQASGKVFTLVGTQSTSHDRLVKGTCFINGVPLIDIIDTGATHSFIFVDCVTRLGIIPSTLDRKIMIRTPSIVSVVTSLVCLNCPLTIFDRDFGVDLICLPLSNLDVILGMD